MLDVETIKISDLAWEYLIIWPTNNDSHKGGNMLRAELTSVIGG